jgi:hypothetical protein
VARLTALLVELAAPRQAIQLGGCSGGGFRQHGDEEEHEGEAEARKMSRTGDRGPLASARHGRWIMAPRGRGTKAAGAATERGMMHYPEQLLQTATAEASHGGPERRD